MYGLKRNILFILLLFTSSCALENASRSKNRGLGESSGPVFSSDVLLMSACACQAGVSLSLGNSCDAFCQNKTHQNRLLHIETLVDPIVLENFGFDTLEQWCKEERLDDSGEVINDNPGCVLEAIDEVRNTTEELEVIISNDEIIVDLTALRTDVNYILTLFERSSGDSSSTLQTMVSLPNGSGVKAPDTVIVHNYECTKTLGPTDQEPDRPDLPVEVNYFWSIHNPINDIDPSLSNLACRVTDGAPGFRNFFYQYLDLEFLIWSPIDIKFSRNNEGVMLIQEGIEKRLGISNTNADLFVDFKLHNRPISSDTEEEPKVLGHILNSIFVNPNNQSQVVRCLDERDYLSSADELYHELAKTLQGDLPNPVITEALYIAERESITFPGPYTPPIEETQNFILVTKSMINQKWYWKFNNQAQKILNSDGTMENGDLLPTAQKIYFTHTSLSDPFFPKEYKIVHPSDNATQSGSIIPHDRRIGCVPK